MERTPAPDRRRQAAFVLAAAAAHLAFAFWWVAHRLGGFYYARGDDAERLTQALAWSAHPSLDLIQAWLPVNRWLLGSVLMIWRDPYRAPLYAHAVAASAIVCLTGLIALELFSEEPWVGPWAALAAMASPLFERLALSAGSEVDCWLFLLLPVYLWLLYRRTGSARWLWLCAAGLAVGSMTRYEVWLYNFAFIAATLPRERRLPLRAKVAFVCAAFAPVAVYIGFQELHLPPPGQGGQNSYAGLRVGWEPSPLMARSFWVPARLSWRASPWASVLAASALVFVALKKRDRAWYSLFVILSALLLSGVAATVGMVTIAQRLIGVFYLLAAPAAACLLLSAARERRRALILAAAAAIALVSWRRGLPRAQTAAHMGAPEVYELLEQAHAAEAGLASRPGWLVESSLMSEYDEGFLFVALDRLSIEDSGYFRGRSPAALADLLRRRRIGWIAVQSPEAVAALARARFVAQAGGVKLFAFGLPKDVDAPFRAPLPWFDSRY